VSDGSATSEDADHGMSDPSPSLDAIAQLRGVEGRIHELQRLINADAHAMEVLSELAAATEALQRVC
jgi:DNA-binding FrmR family transcriptional regulator